jgi:hypothetical protein
MEGRSDRMRWRNTIKRRASKQSLGNNRFTWMKKTIGL